MIDRRANDTMAAGIVRVSLPARVNVSWQAVTVDRAARAAAKRQKPCVVLFTGLIVLVSLISPFRAERELARATVEDDQFIEVYVDTPLAVCEARDPKGLYRRARAGEIRNFTGIDSAYEPPLEPELVLTATEVAPAALAERVADLLRQRRIVD